MEQYPHSAGLEGTVVKCPNTLKAANCVKFDHQCEAINKDFCIWFSPYESYLKVIKDIKLETFNPEDRWRDLEF